MKRIELDFHPGGARRKRAAGWVLLAIALLVAVALTGHYGRLKEEQQHIRTMLMQQAEQQAPTANVDIKVLEPQFERAAAVIDHLAFPWDQLFVALESSMNEDVALLSVQPDVAVGIVTLNAEARDWNAMLEYIRRLGQDKFFTDVHLVSHQIQQDDPQRPIRFVLSCAWVAAPAQKTLSP